MHAFHTLAPIFLVVLLGVLFRRFGLFDAAAQAGMNRVCYWVGLPSLLFLKIALAAPAAGSALTVAQLVLGVSAVVIVLGLLAARLLRLRAAQVGTFLQAAFRGNLAYIGLAVVIFAYADSPQQDAAQSTAAVALAPIVVVYNIVAVVVLLASEHRLSLASLPRLLAKVLTNPLLIAGVLGWGWNRWTAHSGAHLWPFAYRFLDLIGSAALPVALLCVGGALAATSMHGSRLGAIVAAVLKTAAAPLLCILLARWMGADRLETGIAAILCATPTAIASYVLTDQLNGDTALAAASIVLSTLASAVSLTVVVALV